MERVCGSYSGSISPLRREETSPTEEALPVCASSLSLRVHNNKREVCNRGTEQSAFLSQNFVAKNEQNNIFSKATSQDTTITSFCIC